MELTPTQINLINCFLPSRYKLDSISKIESRPLKVTQRRSETENLDFNVRFQPTLPEKRPQREKRSNSDEFPESRPKLTEGYKKLSKILSELKKHPKIAYFLNPKPKTSEEEDLIALSDIESKLNSGEYETGYQFALDMRSIWTNSFFHNSNVSEIYSATMELSTYFEKLMKGNEDVIVGEKKNLVQDLYRKIDKLSKGIKVIQNKPQPVPPKPQVKVQFDRPLGFLEKKQLCQNIKKLEPKYLKGVLDIVKECMDINGQELEFDIEKLPPKVSRDLDKYVKNCMQSINKSQKKKQANIEGIKSAQEANSEKIKDLNNQIQKLSETPKNDVYLPEEESDSESSSTSESEEEEVPNIQTENFLQKDEENGDLNSSFGNMVDFDKIY